MKSSIHQTKIKAIGFLRFYWLVLFLAFAPLAFAQNNPIEINYDFRQGTLGWTADFADYLPEKAEFYKLFSGLRFMPRKLTILPQRGFYIRGQNNSADLFMFLKRRLNAQDGIVAGQAYQIQYDIIFASNAPNGCAGSGAPPGEGVFLKAGVSAVEPLSVLQPDGYRRMNVDIGNQGNGGEAASLAGDIANGISCEMAAPRFPFNLVQRKHQHPTKVSANENAELWLLVGTDSGFEGLTRLYYKNIFVRLVPVSKSTSNVIQ